MQIPKSIVSRHRRQRLRLWAMAMLTWVAAILFGGKEIDVRRLRQRHRAMSLDGLTRMTVRLLIVRAGECARRKRAKRLRFFRHGRDLRRPHLIRSLLGSRLRHALRPRGLAERVAALVAVLRDLDTFAARLAVRMKRRLTRLWPILSAPTTGGFVLSAPPPSAPALADSS